jgi:hypothetical protein
MSMPDIDDNVVESGPYGTIGYAIRLDGTRPAKDGLDKLSKKDYRKYSRLKMIMRQFVTKGHLPPSKMDGYSNSKLRKFKHSEAYPWRLPFFTVENRHYLTHLFEKKGDTYNQEQIEKAKMIRAEHYARMGWSDAT